MTPKQNWINLLILCSLLIFGGKPAYAQITPDGTLGAEQSNLTPNVTIGTTSADLIDGGAQRGSNLFHSFGEFNVNNGQRVYFANPADVQNILTRVTGGQVSNILGTLGVDGSANLFLLNPNGIVFGQNAQLDVRGAFVGTTANGIGFGEQGIFNATNPESPPLLTVNPRALLFNQLNQSSIVSNSLAPVGTSPAGQDLFGLRVPDGQSLLLVGGDVQIDGGGISGGLNAQGGRIELGGLTGTGAIGLDNSFQLTYPNNVARSNVSLVNDARVNVRGNGGGDVVVNANEFTATDGGRLAAGTEGTGNAGNIMVNANTVNLAGSAADNGGSGIFNQVLDNATGNGGNVIVNTNVFNISSNARIDTRTFGQGNSGNIIVNTNAFNISSDARINTSTFGRGNGGNAIINARDTVTMDNVFILSEVQEDAIGLGGDIRITTGSLSLNNNAQLIAGTRGQGNSGNVIINTRDAVTLDNAAIFSDVEPDAIGIGGDISITTGVLSLINGAQLLTRTSGRGDAGNVRINARDINFQGSFSDGNNSRSGIFTQVAK